MKICAMVPGACKIAKRFFRELIGMWKYGDTRYAAVASILSAYFWAACLLWPGETMDRPTYHHMAEVLDTDEKWAVLFLIVGTLQFWRLYARTTRRNLRFDYLLKIVACSMWTFVGLACMFSIYPPPAAMSDTLVISIATWWDMVRHGSHCRICPQETCAMGECPYAR